MSIPHEKFCVLPWISFEASPIGTVRPCCLTENEILDDQGNKFNLANGAKLTDIQDSQHMKVLRQQFLQGTQPKDCAKCWNEEDAGRTSKRMHTLKKLEPILRNEVWTKNSKPLQFLDLKLGNICNLKCRICGSWSSSTFAVEEIEFSPIAEKKTGFHYQMLKQGRWPRDSNDFWQQIDNIIDQIRYIEFTGGEPFMIKEHFQFLERIVDKGIAGQVEIHYNTNGTQYPDNAEDIWKHFKLVEIAFSVDDIGPRFEYQRANAIWSEVESNIARFMAMRDRHCHIKLQVCITVNVFNVMYLEDVANWADVQGFDFIYWNMLHEARYHSIGALPDSTKQIIRDRLTNINVSDQNRLEINCIIDFMMNGQELGDTYDLINNILRVDGRRQQDLQTHHYEFAKAIGYNGPV